jgi:hypothetical protein
VPIGGIGAASVLVVTPGGTISPATFTYIAPPTFSSVLPAGGPLAGGNSVVIVGAGLTTTSDVTFGGGSASYVVDADNQISAVVPAGTGTVDIVVTTIGGDATATSAYQYVTAPVLGALSQNAGPVAGGNTAPAHPSLTRTSSRLRSAR